MSDYREQTQPGDDRQSGDKKDPVTDIPSTDESRRAEEADTVKGGRQKFDGGRGIRMDR